METFSPSENSVSFLNRLHCQFSPFGPVYRFIAFTWFSLLHLNRGVGTKSGSGGAYYSAFQYLSVSNLVWNFLFPRTGKNCRIPENFLCCLNVFLILTCLKKVYAENSIKIASELSNSYKQFSKGTFLFTVWVKIIRYLKMFELPQYRQSRQKMFMLRILAKIASEPRGLKNNLVTLGQKLLACFGVKIKKKHLPSLLPLDNFFRGLKKLSRRTLDLQLHVWSYIPQCIREQIIDLCAKNGWQNKSSNEELDLTNYAIGEVKDVPLCIGGYLGPHCGRLCLFFDITA